MIFLLKKTHIKYWKYNLCNVRLSNQITDYAGAQLMEIHKMSDLQISFGVYLA